MTAEQLAVIAGVGLTTLFSYVPGLDVWYEGRSGQVKSLIMLGLVFVIALGIFGLSCYSPYQYFTCDAEGAWELARIFGNVAIGNLGSYLYTRKMRSKRFHRLTDGMYPQGNTDPSGG